MSVLLPCRDAAGTLPEAIESLREQTFVDFEVVAVDDASGDETMEILRDWAGEDRRVTVLSTEAPGPVTTGLIPALNLAAGAARAPLLARMDADDVAHARRLETQLTFLAANPDLAGCGTNVELFSDAASADRQADTPLGSGYRRYERWINAIETPDDVARNALIECPVAHPSLVLKASVFRAIGGYRDTGWPEDYDLVLRVLAAGARLANVSAETPLLRWRVRPDRHSLTSDTYAPAAFRRCRVHFLREAFLPAGREVVIWGAGKVGKPLARELIRQGTPVAAFVDLDPRKIGQEIHGARVLSPAEFEARVAAARTPDACPYVLAAVGSPGVRGEIRGALSAAGLDELTDYRFCA